MTVPFLRIELVIFLHLIVNGFGVVVGDVRVDDFDAVCWKVLFDLIFCPVGIHYLSKLKILKIN